MKSCRVVTVLVLALMIGAVAPQAQQLGDPDFPIVVTDPAYPGGSGPVVAIDEAHQNFHTLAGRYGTFAAILEADGYRLTAQDGPFTAEGLAGIDILVIANAGLDGGAPWKLPTPSVFTAEEVAAVAEWVREGGALWLIADHMPAGGAAENLAAAFGIRLTNGYTREPADDGVFGDAFTRASGTLYDHAIARGRSPAEGVDTVITFTGQAFQAQAPVDTLLRFGPDAYTLLPLEAGPGLDENSPRVSSGGWLHAAALRFGEGRVAVFGEAAMFTAQVAGPNRIPVGLNSPYARQNQQLLLNTAHWLSGLIGG